ncbi:STAS domain-containing protein [Actinomadura nitritigenes]|uniref:STAS domain-containing protein n=1 Tax=Actinomadura nitritigenes TaxID=134602 RepID=UPI003D8C097E
MLVQSATPQVTPDHYAGESTCAESAPCARPALAFETGTRDGATVLTMKGQLVAETAVIAEAKILTTTVLAGRPLNLVLDLTEVDAIDQHGTALLTKTRFTVSAARGTLHLVAPPGGAVHPTLNRYLRRISVPYPQDVPAAPGAHTAGTARSA